MKFFDPTAYQAIQQSVKDSPLLKPAAPAVPAAQPVPSVSTPRRRAP